MANFEIFKFKKIDKNLLKMVIHSELYFASPADLNDPFDLRVDLLRSLANAFRQGPASSRANLEKLRDGIPGFFTQLQRDIATLGVCSFSLKLVNSLMWAHYADNHRGVCLFYRIPESFFHERKDHILGVSKVEYSVYPITDLLLQWAAGPPGTLEAFRDKLLIEMLTAKAKSWEYEEEARIVRRTPGVEIIDRQYLKQVCFGLETSQSDTELVMKALDQGGYQATRCKMIRDHRTDFGIEAGEI